jgi:hypothetical protein
MAVGNLHPHFKRGLTKKGKYLSGLNPQWLEPHLKTSVPQAVGTLASIIRLLGRFLNLNSKMDWGKN